MKVTRRTILFIAILSALSPIFGILLADAIGYTEPLDIVADRLGVREGGLWRGPLHDYSIPGLPSALGYAISVFTGAMILIFIGVIIERMRSRGPQ